MVDYNIGIVTNDHNVDCAIDLPGEARGAGWLSGETVERQDEFGEDLCPIGLGYHVLGRHRVNGTPPSAPAALHCPLHTDPDVKLPGVPAAVPDVYGPVVHPIALNACCSYSVHHATDPT